MSVIMYVYCIFSIVLVCVAILTFTKLCNASTKNDFPPAITSVEDFLLWTNPKFPILTLAKILPGSFVGFGILGTFLGFANGISGINISSGSEDVFNSIGTLLNGMNTAFYTSIAGVVLSIFFSIVFQCLLHNIKAKIKKLSNTEENQKENIVLSMQDYVNQVKELTQSLVNAKNSMEALPLKFSEVGQSLEASIVPVKETFSQMEKTLQNYAEQAKMMETASNEIGSTLKNFSQANEKITQNISEIFEKSEAMNKNIIEENIALTEAHKTTLEEYRILDEHISTALEKLNANVKEYSEALEETIKNIFSNTSESFRNTAENIYKKITESVTAEHEMLVNQRKQDLDDYKQLDENISTALEKLNANVKEYSATIEKTLVETLERFTKAAQEVSGALLEN